MEETQVYAASCPDYGQAEEAIRALVEQMGGMGRFVRPGERIVLKANLLRAAPPESAICTHPAVVEAVAKLVKEAGGTPVICDSPGGALHKEAVLRSLYEKTGMAAAAAMPVFSYRLRSTASLCRAPPGLSQITGVPPASFTSFATASTTAGWVQMALSGGAARSRLALRTIRSPGRTNRPMPPICSTRARMASSAWP